MKWHMTILALIWTLKIIHTDSSQECPKNNYIIIDKNGNKQECLPCQPCNFGYGLTPSCGRELTEEKKVNIKCVLCRPGETYSDEHGPSSCKSCQICPVTLKNCTKESNTQCSRDCRRGYYYDNSTYNCQPCSYCCKKDNKRIAECAGLSAQSQCSVNDSLKCSPKTTRNPWPSALSTKNGSASDDKGIKTVIIVIAIVIVVVVVAVAVVTVWCVHKHREPRQHDGPESEQLRHRPNYCGITKASFVLMVNPPLAPRDEVQEGKELSIICKNHSNTQDENCFDNCNYVYDWKKDMMEFPGCNEQKVDFRPIQVQDFGIYTCKVKCREHPHQCPAEAKTLDLDVAPGPAKKYKTFTEIDSLEVYDKIADMLTAAPIDIGDWKRVAENYGLTPLKIRSMKGDDERGMQVIEYIKASQPKLTVYDFCKFMKTLKQNQIVELLENRLTCENQDRRRVNERDSGYDCYVNGQSSSSLVVPGAGPNNLGFKDSPQGSRNELADSHNDKENPDKINRKLDRQISNQSARSSGSAGSRSASSSLKRAAKGLVRLPKLSQNSTYKKH